MLGRCFRPNATAWPSNRELFGSQVFLQQSQTGSLAGLVFSVTEIDGIPVPLPTTEQQIEALVERLGDDGLDAIVQSLQPGETDGSFGTHVGNLPSTLS